MVQPETRTKSVIDLHSALDMCLSKLEDLNEDLNEQEQNPTGEVKDIDSLISELNNVSVGDFEIAKKIPNSSVTSNTLLNAAPPTDFSDDVKDSDDKKVRKKVSIQRDESFEKEPAEKQQEEQKKESVVSFQTKKEEEPKPYKDFHEKKEAKEKKSQNNENTVTDTDVSSTEVTKSEDKPLKKSSSAENSKNIPSGSISSASSEVIKKKNRKSLKSSRSGSANSANSEGLDQVKPSGRDRSSTTSSVSSKAQVSKSKSQDASFTRKKNKEAAPEVEPEATGSSNKARPKSMVLSKAVSSPGNVTGLSKSNSDANMRLVSESPVTSFNIVEARKALKKKKIFGKDKAAQRQLSLRALQLPIDTSQTEDKVDQYIISLLDSSTGFLTEKKKSSEFRTFTGKQFGEWVRKEFSANDESTVVQIAQTMFMNRGVFYTTSKKHLSFYPKEKCVYKFTLTDPTNLVMNMGKICVLEDIGDIVEMSRSILEKGKALLAEHASNDGKSIDFEAIRKSKNFFSFALDTTKIQKVDLKSLDKFEKVAFLVNVYNTMVIHHHILYGAPKTSIARKESVNKSYRIGQKDYTFEMIINTLRGLNPKITKLEKNPLFLCCLFNDTDTSPPLTPISTADVEDSSRFATLVGGFLDKHAKIKVGSDELFLPRLFKDYGDDFGNKKDLLKALSTVLPDATSKYIVSYIDTIEVKFLENTYENVRYL